jgi:hypothetical protein
MIGWAITPAIMRSPFAELTRTLEAMAAAGIETVELPIEAAPAVPLPALRKAAEGLGLALSARMAEKLCGLSAGHAFGIARDLGCTFLVVDALDDCAHRRWHDASQATGVALVLDAASLDRCSPNCGVQTKVLVELGAANAAADSGSALLRAAGERLGCVRLVSSADEAGGASSSRELEWAAALAGCAYFGPIICSGDAAFQASAGVFTAARRLLRWTEKIEWELSFGGIREREACADDTDTIADCCR